VSDKIIKSKILQILAHKLDLRKYKVYLFGSRSYGNSNKWSDYDIGLEGNQPISRPIIAQINSDLAESSLPIHVDVVDFAQVSPDFKSLALESAKIWKAR